MSNHNILVKTDRSHFPVFEKGGEVNKRLANNWSNPGPKGTFRHIHKHNLNIDGRYQRTAVSEEKIMKIARNWSWAVYQVLTVVLRKDGTYWVVEGGHRVRAAFYRDDIDMLPCIVFEEDQLSEEAMMFYGINSCRTTINAFGKHKALVVSEDEMALLVNKIVEDNGYTVTACSRPGGFTAVGSLRKWVMENAPLANQVFAGLARIAVDREPFSGDLYGAVYTCLKKLNGSVDPGLFLNSENLLKSGIRGMDRAVSQQKVLLGKTGDLVGARAILDLYNKRKRVKLTWED
jgi:hypothetical protein